MTLRRRDLFGLGALGLGAVALEGCGTPVIRRPGAAMTARDVDRMLDELDRVVAHLEALDADPTRFGIRGHSVEVAQGKQRCIALLTTLCFMGTYRDVPESVWREPHVAAHLARSLPRIKATIASARDHLAGMTEDEVATIERGLTHDPDLPMKIMERMDGYAKELDVPLEQRTYLRLTTAQLAARYRHEGIREVIGKLVSSYGRVLKTRMAEVGVEEDAVERATVCAPQPRGALSKSRGLLASPDISGPLTSALGEVGESCVSATDCQTGLDCIEGECKPLARSERLMNTNRDVSKWGAIFLIPPLCGIGALILLESLFIVVVAGILHAGGD